MIRTTVRYGDVVSAAAARCGLAVRTVLSPRPGRPVANLCTPAGRPLVHVYAEGTVRSLTWLEGPDDDVLAFLGEAGCRLRTAVVLAEAACAAKALSLTHSVRARSDGSVHLEFRKADSPMSQPILTARISPSGDVKAEVDCAVGAVCADLTAGLERRFGGVATQELKPEYHAATTVEQPNELKAS